jgi:hypothetical protein
MIGSGNATAVKSVVGRLLPGQARCWKDDVAPAELIFIVVCLLAYGCPLQAIVHVFGLDERTVAAWRDRAGQQCQRVQQAVVQQGQLTLTHVQADEIRVKGKKGIFWMGLAMPTTCAMSLLRRLGQSSDVPVSPTRVRSCSEGREGDEEKGKREKGV